MKNLINPKGARVGVKTIANVTSGTLANVNGLLGIPVDHALNGATVTFIQEGIVALTFTGQGTIGAGSYLYWNIGATPTAAALSLGAAAGDLMVGQVLGASPDGVATVYSVRLNLTGPRATAGGAQVVS